MRLRLTFCSLATLLLAGCAYDGSRFQYQSGGLPFLGMTMAIGDDGEGADVRHATAESQRRTRFRLGLPRFTRTPRSADLPEGRERVLEAGDDELMNAF